MLGEPGGVQRQGLEVAAKARRVAQRHQVLRVPGQQLVQIPVQPCLPRRAGQPEQRLRETAAQGQLDVTAQVGHLRGQAEPAQIGLGEPVHEQRARRAAEQLAHGDPVEPQPDKAAGAGPGLGLQVGADAAGQKEPAGPRSIIHGSLDRAEYRGDGLPLVEQQRLGLPAQRGVGIGAEGGSLGRAVEADHGSDEPPGGRRLPGRAGAGDQDRGQLREQFGEVAVS